MLPRCLLPSEVIEMRNAYAEGKVTISYLAKHYSVSRRTVQRLLSGDTYAELPGPTFPEPAETGRRMPAPFVTYHQSKKP